MTPASRRPRFEPVDLDALDDEVLSVPPQVAATIPNLVGTWARHPVLARRLLALSAALLDGVIPPRDRELLILRTAHNCGCDYEFGQHVRLATSAGLTNTQIDTILEDDPGDVLDTFDLALVAAADELHATATLSDATWDRLASRYDNEALLEVAVLVGNYHTVAYTVGAVGITPEPGLPTLP